MSRRLCLTLAAILTLAGYPPAHGQDTSAATTSTPTADDVATLQAENATLKKEVADARQTIAQLQAKLTEAEKNQSTPTTEPMAADGTAPASTNAAPSGPQKALPLDATNVTTNPAAPGTDAGPSKSYTVVKGDSIWKIAHKMYPGDTKNGVDKIEEANKDAIGGKPLKIGQVLVIPQ